MNLVTSPNKSGQLCSCSLSFLFPLLIIWQEPSPSFLKVQNIAGRATLNRYHHPNTFWKETFGPSKFHFKENALEQCKAEKPHARDDIIWQKLQILLYQPRLLCPSLCIRALWERNKRQMNNIICSQPPGVITYPARTIAIRPIEKAFT